MKSYCHYHYFYYYYYLLLLLYYHLPHDVRISRVFLFKKNLYKYGEGCRLERLIGRVSETFIK